MKEHEGGDNGLLPPTTVCLFHTMGIGNVHAYLISLLPKSVCIEVMCDKAFRMFFFFFLRTWMVQTLQRDSLNVKIKNFDSQL